jgi:hypothetical protein
VKELCPNVLLVTQPKRASIETDQHHRSKGPACSAIRAPASGPDLGLVFHALRGRPSRHLEDDLDGSAGGENGAGSRESGSQFAGAVRVRVRRSTKACWSAWPRAEPSLSLAVADTSSLTRNLSNCRVSGLGEDALSGVVSQLSATSIPFFLAAFRFRISRWCPPRRHVHAERGIVPRGFLRHV